MKGFRVHHECFFFFVKLYSLFHIYISSCLRKIRRTTDECYFLERLESNNYNTYRSRKYPDWYVALKRTGQYKAGSKTGPGQKAILFLPMTAKC
uniref:Fibroblast growth factor 2 n=1 Tax=Sinocyclocheilus rhinocerous TaxID=307959 RepID=A0A673KWP7_9TELE